MFWLGAFITAGIFGILSGILSTSTGIRLYDSFLVSNFLNSVAVLIGIITAIRYTKD